MLLAIGVLVNYFDRVNLSVAHDAIVAHFGISPITFGYLAAAYSWTYCACQLPIGVVLDRWGVRRVMLIGTALFSLASFSASAATGIVWLFAARLLLGVGEAPTFPANAKAIGMWFEEKDRSVATSIFDSAAKFASAIGVPLLGVLLLHMGWRKSFMATGTLSALYLILFAVVYRDPSATVSQQARLDAQPAMPLGQILRNRSVIAVAFGFSSYCYVFYLLLAWLPTYLSNQMHLDLQRSFLFTGLPWLVATVSELSIGGLLVSVLIRRGWDGGKVRRGVVVWGLVCGLGILGVALTHSVAWALFWLSISIGGLAATAPVTWAILPMLVPRSSTGAAGGVVNFASQITAVLAPIVTGYAVQWTHSFAWAFGIAAAILMAGIAGYIWLLDLKQIGHSEMA